MEDGAAADSTDDVKATQARWSEGFPQAATSDTRNTLNRIWVINIRARSLFTFFRPPQEKLIEPYGSLDLPKHRLHYCLSQEIDRLGYLGVQFAVHVSSHMTVFGWPAT
jgi:hypothetical protein